VYETHCRHYDTPENHDGWDEDRGFELLKQDVGQRFEAGVGCEEQRQASGVFASGQVKVLGQAVDFGIADVGTVWLVLVERSPATRIFAYQGS
jgi:hypothetical protein